ncbi:unnamed protein product [Parajaminaea phylloscopi]
MAASGSVSGLGSEASSLNEAIALRGLSDRPLSETSTAPAHALRNAGQTKQGSSRSSGDSSPEQTRRAVNKRRHSSSADPADTSLGEDDDLVVYESAAGAGLEGSTSSNAARPQATHSSPSTVRASLESVSFGFRDNLLPLSLSRADYDDEDESFEQVNGQGSGRGPMSARNNYGELESSATSSSAHGRNGAGPRSRRGRKAREPQRRMGLIDGIALTVGLQIGSGIFSSPGVVTLNTGSIGSSLIVWLFSGVLAWCGASSFAELGSAIPQNGGAQAYLNYSFGALPSYLFSWTAIVALKPGSGAIISIIFGEYVARIIFHTATASADHPHEQGLEGIPAWSIKVIACAIVVVVSAINAFSARLGTRTQIATTVVKLFALVAVPILAIVFAARGKMPEDSRKAFSSFGHLFSGSSTSPSSYALALYSGLWAYDGWDQASYVGGEMRNVARDLPRVIHSSMSLVILFFSVTVVSYFLVLAPSLVMRTNTVALDFGSAVFGGSTAGGVVFACLVAFSCFGAINSQVYTSSRLVYAAGKEGYLPATFGTINKRTATPVAATIFQALLVIVFIVFGSGFASLVSFYGVCSYTWYFLTVVGLLVLRVKEPHLERPYRTWLVTPVIFATTALFLLVMPIASAPLEAAAAFAFMAAGLPAYFVSTGSWRNGGGALRALLQRCWGSKAVNKQGQGAVVDRGNAHEYGDEYEEEEGDEEEAVEMLQRPASGEWGHDERPSFTKDRSTQRHSIEDVESREKRFDA